MSLRLLGPPAFLQDGSATGFRLDRPGSLIAYLAVRGTKVSRAELAVLYRPDEAEVQALAFLRQLVFRARRHPAGTGIVVTETALELDIDSDVRRFRQAARAGNHAAALAEYGGPLLEGASIRDAEGINAWLLQEREVLQREWMSVAAAHAAALEQAGDHVGATELLTKLLAVDPLDEDSVVALMRLQAASGRRRDALHAFDDFRALLAEELGVEPLETTLALADDIRSQPAEPTAPVGPHTHSAELPVPVTSFVGRQPELERLRALFAGDARLVTIVGLGGAGKTRLAVEAANLLKNGFKDGVAFVTLEGVPGPAALAPTLLDSLGLSWAGETEASLTLGLRSRQLLLVLDGFEGVVEAAALVARLLEAAAGLRVLVTSREALHVTGETLLDLSGLTAPEPGAELEASDFDAVQLFVKRAARIDPDFTPTAKNLAAIADMCRWLGGLPLAIELVATWVRALGCLALRDELRRNADLLTTTLRDVPERHRSLWTVLDYSWERLTPAERSAVSGLTVFRGDFSLEAAVQVAGASLPVLLNLMNRTLVRRWGEGRFRLHELVRQYAAARNDERTAQDQERKHAAYFASRLSALKGDLQGTDPVGALAQVEADAANFEAAWYYAVHRADLALLDDARDALDYYWHYRGLWGAAVAAYGQAASAIEAEAMAGGQQAARLHGRLLVHLAQYERAMGAPGAREHAHAGLASLLQYGSAADVAHAHLEIASGAVLAGDYEQATAAFRQALTAGQELSDAYLQGAAWNGLGNVTAYTGGELPLVEEYYSNSLAAHSSIGNLEGVNGALINIGAARYDAGDLAGAASKWREAAAIAERLGYVQREAVLHNNLGALAEAQANTAAAAEHYERSLLLRRRLSDRSGEATVLRNLARLAFEQERYEDAAAGFRESLSISEALQQHPAMATTSEYLARTLAALGEIDAA